MGARALSSYSTRGIFRGSIRHYNASLKHSSYTTTESILNDDTYRWLFAFKEPKLISGIDRMPVYKHIEDRDKVIGNTEGLDVFYRQLDKSKQDKLQLKTYEDEIIELNDILAGRSAKDRAEGARLKSIETAKNMIKRNRLSTEELAEDTGLTQEEVDALKAEYDAIQEAHRDGTTGALAAAVQQWIRVDTHITVDGSEESNLEENLTASLTNSTVLSATSISVANAV